MTTGAVWLKSRKGKSIVDPEDLLSNMFKSFGFGKGQDISKVLNTLVRNVQINMLRQLRREIDNNIKKLTQEGATNIAYDESLDPFKILGVEPDATKEEITRAFREKALKAHPDRGGSNEEMVRVNAAYEAIRQFRGWN